MERNKKMVLSYTVDINVNSNSQVEEQYGSIKAN